MNAVLDLAPGVAVDHPVDRRWVAPSHGLPVDLAKVAMVHDWFTVYSGAERVIEQMIALFPKADLFSSIDFLREGERAFLGGRAPTTSLAQHWPLMRRHYRKLLPLLMFAIEQLDVEKYDLVLSSSHAIAKGVLTGPHQLHISYVHSPMRYAWDMQHQYLQEARLGRGVSGLLARWLLHRARIWDLRTANGVDHFIANSAFIARRIWKVYRREATVIHPPVDTELFRPGQHKERFFLTGGRLVPYKRIPMIVEAFARMPEHRLVVVGDGPEMPRVKQFASQNVEILGHVERPDMVRYMQQARAFLFAAQEDFGISPLEAQACGTPVIAYGRGGAVETIQGLDHPEPTGVFFDTQDVPSVIASVRKFEVSEEQFMPPLCRQNAERFSVERFQTRYWEFVQRRWQEFSGY